MSKTTKIFTVSHITEGLEQAWLQHLRDFDIAHPGCHFEVFGDTPDLSAAEVVEMLTISPGLTFSEIFERKK
jgi:hypothetical protein